MGRCINNLDNILEEILEKEDSSPLNCNKIGTCIRNCKTYDDLLGTLSQIVEKVSLFFVVEKNS